MAHTVSEPATPEPAGATPGPSAGRQASAGPAYLRALEFWLFRYKLTWRSSLAHTFGNPLLFMAAIGFGLGTLVNKSPTADLGIPYLTFVAPGLLAGSAMQIAANEATFPVMGSIRWWKSYHAMLATPLSVLDVLVGHLIWMGCAIGLSCSAFLLAMLAFGTVHSWLAVFALPASLLVGAAFAIPITAYASMITNDSGFSVMFRMIILPMLLFSGVFLPVDRMPALLRWVAYGTPLWHGVDLIRGLTLGSLRPGAAGIHILYLATLATVGFLLARRGFQKELLK
jgi:lipooligosaccharide transport system permease protein